MTKMTRAITAFFIVIIMASLLISGCMPMKGSPSLTLITREVPKDSKNIELIGDSDKISDSMYWVLFFGLFGKVGTHEGVVDQMLEKHQADILLNAELTSSGYGIPYIFMVFSDTVEGQPARFVNGGAK